jgi:hypothetical protein
MSRLNEICVQIHPERLGEVRLEEVVRLFLTVDERAQIHSGNDEGVYNNLLYRQDDLPTLWRSIRETLKANPVVGRATIITSTGIQGWDDYQLLHHFDGTLTLDQLS